MREKLQCPFCEGDGCCFCDHTGSIFVGANEMIKSKELVNSIGVKYLKEEDPGEIWPEMWEFFLNEKNVPQEFKDKHNTDERQANTI